MRTLLLASLVCSTLWSQPQIPPEGPPLPIEKRAEGAASKEETSKRRQAPDENTPTIKNQVKASSKEATSDTKTNEELEINRKLTEYTGQLATFTRYLAVVGALQFLALAAQAIIFGITLSENRRLIQVSQISANAAKTSAEAAETSAKALIKGERAWLVVSKIEGPALTPQLLAGTVIEKLCAVSVTNIGRTVARIESPVDANTGVLASESDLPETPHYVELVGWRCPEQPEYGRVLAPKESMNLDIPLGAKLLRIEDVEAVERGERRLYVYASIRYYDFTGDRHELRFCYVYRNRQSGQPAGLYPGGPKEYNKHT